MSKLVKKKKNEICYLNIKKGTKTNSEFMQAFNESDCGSVLKLRLNPVKQRGGFSLGRRRAEDHSERWQKRSTLGTSE